MSSKTMLILCIALALAAASVGSAVLRMNRGFVAGVGQAGPLSAGPWQGFPDMDPDSGKFLGQAGNNLSTLAGQSNKLYLGIPAGRTSFTISVFDGDGEGYWDSPIGNMDTLDYKLYKDPMKSGGSILLDSWTNAGLRDDAWANRTYSTSSDAKAPSGNYFYRIEVNWRDPSTADDIAGFKLKVDGQISVVKNQPFCIEGAPLGSSDPPLGSGDPNPGEQNDPGANSYDGHWSFYFYVPTKTETMNFKDGDFDRADDSDDSNTPNVDPDGSGPAVPEGVNPGAPGDDTPSGSLTIPPSILYNVTDPSTMAYSNDNPSGNQEWEDFIISHNASASPDYLTADTLQPGLWKVSFTGLDAHNLACLSTPYEVYTTDDTPLPLYPPPIVVPDRSAILNIPPAQTLSFAHNVTNTGAAQVFDLDATSEHGWVTRIYHDLNGNGKVDGGEPRVNDTGLLGQNQTYKIVVQVDVPLVPAYVVDVTTVLASSQLEWAVQGSAKDTITVKVNSPPVAEAGGPYTGYENSAVALDGSGSRDPDNDALQYRWDFENDGIWDTAWSSNPKIPHTWGDDWTGKVALQVSDGNLTASDTADVTVNNVLPSGSVTITSSVQHEGNIIQFSAHVTDPGSDDLFMNWTWGDGTPDQTSTYYNNGVGPDPYPSYDIHPRDVTDTMSHSYGDNGAFTVSVFVRDDDSGVNGITLSVTATPDNLPPSVSVSGETTIDEGQSIALTATAIDPGSDDLKFDWSWGEGSSDMSIFYNDGVGPDPPNSPGGTWPFTATDSQTHQYGDNGVYALTLTVTDDDGGSVTWVGQAVVNNLPPEIAPFGPYTVIEASAVSVGTSATDPGSDDLTFIWTFELGPTFQDVFYNDGIGPDPADSPGGTFPFTASDAAAHTYGDDGVFTVTLTVQDDDGASTTYETTVTVSNVPPAIEDVQAYAVTDLTLRVAGEKWHDVCLSLEHNGQVESKACVVRYPGSPDRQSATIHDGRIQLIGDFRIVIYYTPADDPVNGQTNGANPTWVIIEFPGDGRLKLHHTFNVQHPSTWTWTLDNLQSYLVGQEITFEGTASDIGSDDLTFTWSWGDGTVGLSTTHFNNGISPDPYPSPDVNPITATDVATHVYLSAGTYGITLTVTDDDGGNSQMSFAIALG